MSKSRILADQPGTCGLFEGLSPPHLARLLAASRVERHPAGQVLVQRGQPGRHFFPVLAGQVNLVLFSRWGQAKIVETMGPGDSFGLPVVFLPAQGYPLSVVAATDVRVLRVPGREYLAVLRESPQACINLFTYYSSYVHRRVHDIEDLALEDAKHRLLRLIVSRLPPGDGGPAEIVLQETRQELAARLSVSPETVSRMLRQLADSGVVAVRGRVLKVRDRARLRAILDTSP